MINPLKELENVTERLATLVQEPFSANNRDQVLEQIDHLLNEREKLIKQINPPLSNDDQQLIKKIYEKDQEINLKLNHHFLNLKEGIHHMKMQRSSTGKYLNPYSNVTSNDGSYWDKKK